MFFALLEDFVPNKAKISAVKSILKLPEDPLLYKSSPDQPAYKIIDINRYYAAPFSNKADGLEEELTSLKKEWHPFGNKNLDGNMAFWEVAIPTAEVGFGLASNYLYLLEGTRTITLTFNSVVGGDINGKTFKVELTTEKGWLEKEVTVGGEQMIIDIAGGEPAILPYQQKVHGDEYQTDFPMLKATLVNDPGIAYEYESLKNLKTASITLHVDVQNKQTLALSGSTGPLDSSKPFHPFGAAPEHGAVFYIGDKEVFQKSSNVKITLSWKEPFLYSNFFNPHPHPQGVHAHTEFYRRRFGQWIESVGAISILDAASNEVEFNFSLSGDYITDADFSPNEFYKTNKASGFVKFQLGGDFGHALYPMALVEYAKASNGTAPTRLYDPQILSFKLDYTASTTITLDNQNSYLNQSARFFHLHPFGFEEVLPGNSSTDLLPKMVPQYNGDQINVGKDGGEWFIGIKDLKPPQNISILIQLFEGSENPLLEKPEPHIKWDYLRGNKWVPFKSNEVGDGTNKLLESGIVTFSVPRDANNDNTILPADLHWIRASVESAVDAVCQIIDIHAQAATASLVNDDYLMQIGQLPFPADTIKKLLTPAAGIKKVHQPYATFGGTLSETSSSFYTRISEHLRHKNRAITMWDYERMVLENFPVAHKVKCLNHLHFQPVGNQFIYRELAPGHVTVIVIPNIQNQANINPLRPYTSLGDLKRIEFFLKKQVSCFVKLHVRNPLFEAIQAKFKVSLHQGFDQNFYLQLLNQEIIQFLSPWAFDSDVEIGFGGKVYKSEIVNFIEERPYVDYLLDFELKHLTNPPKPDQEVVQASKLVSILVSAAEHDIIPILENAANDQVEDCRCKANDQNTIKENMI